MNARPQAWLLQALKGTLLELGQEPPQTHVLNDLVGNLAVHGVEVAVIAALPLKALTQIVAFDPYGGGLRGG
jgi:HEPN domain-containing protein